ncbi:MAG: S8 family serine peptidase [Candidatus Hodarchaeales archaeon]
MIIIGIGFVSYQGLLPKENYNDNNDLNTLQQQINNNRSGKSLYKGSFYSDVSFRMKQVTDSYLYDTMFFDTLYFDTLFFDTLFFDSLFFDTLFFDTLFFDTNFNASLFFDTLFFDTLFFDTLFFDTLFFDTDFNASFFFDTLFFDTLFFDTLFFDTNFNASLFFDTLFFDTLFFDTLFFDTLFFDTLFFDTLFFDTLFFDTDFNTSLFFDTLFFDTLFFDTLFFDTLFFDTDFNASLFFDTLIFDTLFFDTVNLIKSIEKLDKEIRNTPITKKGKSVGDLLEHKSNKVIKKFFKKFLKLKKLKSMLKLYKKLLTDFYKNLVVYLLRLKIISILFTPPSWHDQNPETPWGVERIFNGEYTGDQYSESNVQIAILDSGIDPTHSDIVNNIAWSYDATGNNDITDETGHGTHMAGIIGAQNDGKGITGVYADADLYSIKILADEDNIGEWDWFIDGIYTAVEGPDGIVGTEDDSDIISMSIETLGEKPPQAVHEAIKYAYNHGVVLISAAGNSGDSNLETIEETWPAAYPEVIAVGATAINDSLVDFSNTAPYIEVVAPGYNILSTFLNNNYAIASGTSMAVPHVAGLVALIIAENGHIPVGTLEDLNDNTIRGILHTTAIDLGLHGWDTGYGYGLIQYIG